MDNRITLNRKAVASATGDVVADVEDARGSFMAIVKAEIVLRMRRIPYSCERPLTPSKTSSAVGSRPICLRETVCRRTPIHYGPLSSRGSILSSEFPSVGIWTVSSPLRCFLHIQRTLMMLKMHSYRRSTWLASSVFPTVNVGPYSVNRSHHSFPSTRSFAKKH